VIHKRFEVNASVEAVAAKIQELTREPPVFWVWPSGPSGEDGRRVLPRCPWCDGYVKYIDQVDGLSTWTCDNGHDYLDDTLFRERADGERIVPPHVWVSTR
jgi:hypothetical protein